MRRTRRRSLRILLLKTRVFEGILAGPGRDSQQYGTMPVLACPCWCALSLRVGGNQEEGLSAGILRPKPSVSPSCSDTQVRLRKCILHSIRIRNSVACCAKLVVGLGVCYFRRHECSKACSLARRRNSRQYGSKPVLACPVRVLARR